MFCFVLFCFVLGGVLLLLLLLFATKLAPNPTPFHVLPLFYSCMYICLCSARTQLVLGSPPGLRLRLWPKLGTLIILKLLEPFQTSPTVEPSNQTEQLKPNHSQHSRPQTFTASRDHPPSCYLPFVMGFGAPFETLPDRGTFRPDGIAQTKPFPTSNLYLFKRSASC